MAVYSTSSAGRVSQKKYFQKSRTKRLVWEAVKRAVADGVIVKQPCIVCGDCKSEAHHSDYSKPLDVDWLCKRHHGLWHRYLEPFNLV